MILKGKESYIYIGEDAHHEFGDIIELIDEYDLYEKYIIYYQVDSNGRYGPKGMCKKHEFIADFAKIKDLTKLESIIFGLDLLKTSR